MVRTGRGSTVKDPLGGSTDKERRGPVGAHHSDGEDFFPGRGGEGLDL